MPTAAVEIILLPMLKTRWKAIMLQIHGLIREHPPKEDIMYEISTENL
jgi:hypothetical protein